MSNLSEAWTNTDGWRFQRITAECNHYIVFVDPNFNANNAIAMTGADVTKQIRIPFAHRVNKIVLVHLSAALALSADALNIDFGSSNGSDYVQKLKDSIWTETASTISKFTEVFGDGYEYEARTWTLTLNSTATDLIIPVIYVQLVGKNGYK